MLTEERKEELRAAVRIIFNGPSTNNQIYNLLTMDLTLLEEEKHYCLYWFGYLSGALNRTFL